MSHQLLLTLNRENISAAPASLMRWHGRTELRSAVAVESPREHQGRCGHGAVAAHVGGRPPRDARGDLPQRLPERDRSPRVDHWQATPAPPAFLI